VDVGHSVDREGQSHLGVMTHHLSNT
jgi:hypothetical protein